MSMTSKPSRSAQDFGDALLGESRRLLCRAEAGRSPRRGRRRRSGGWTPGRRQVTRPAPTRPRRRARRAARRRCSSRSRRRRARARRSTCSSRAGRCGQEAGDPVVGHEVDLEGGRRGQGRPMSTTSTRPAYWEPGRVCRPTFEKPSVTVRSAGTARGSTAPVSELTPVGRSTATTRGGCGPLRSRRTRSRIPRRGSPRWGRDGRCRGGRRRSARRRRGSGRGRRSRGSFSTSAMSISRLTSSARLASSARRFARR